ncbi:hypothetical protein PBV87_07635 [Niameybacter massiliensis]|uniref:CAAX prenyl protease 2/Lysostaphin resistance protein A-like domain-containing protein n=1 Tax=Holtiella tumoricola TaxID=3018743 RepID=A0AA42DLW8_9FIRM|nr:CPBP family glutamic-type intramembrane protease [Holtiella tumoricola]MDA3731349.1 hypothetical protein [Holtiella tumoricola]
MMIKKRRVLSYIDVVILTFILFGQAIYNSTITYVGLMDETTSVFETTSFSTKDNYYAFITQFVFLFVAFLYLRARKFDFSVWNININLSSFGKGVLLFLLLALCMDGFNSACFSITQLLFPSSVGKILGCFNFSVVIYAILNGFYEEIYFLGICTCVDQKRLKYLIPFSMIVRFSFHTYQGIISALGLGFVLGGLIYFLYSRSKTKNLFPFFVAHTFADILGLGIVYYLF